MNIYDLLLQNGYPGGHIQGHHTRLCLSDMNFDGMNIRYQVFNKDNDGRYTIVEYDGENETEAVKAYNENEVRY